MVLLLFFHPALLIKPVHVVYRGSFIDLVALVSPSTSYICSHLLVNLPPPGCCNCLLSRLTCATATSCMVRFEIFLVLKFFSPFKPSVQDG